MKLLDNHHSTTSRKCAAIASAHQVAEKIRRATLTEIIIQEYLNKVPVQQIAENVKAQHAEVLGRDTISVISGGIYLLVNELVPETTRAEISFSHRSAHAQDNVTNGIGIHNKKTGKELNRKNGKKKFKEKSGLFDLSPKQIRENAQKGAFASMKTQGKVSWQRDIVEEHTGLRELEYCMHLANLEDFIYQTGRKKGQRKCQKIANELNDKFPNEQSPRTARQVSIRISKERKKRA